MTDITIGTKLRAVKTGLIATVADVNKKYRTAFVEFNDDTNASYSLSTLKDKRRFVVVTNDDDVESVKKQESEALEAVSEEHIEDPLEEHIVDVEVKEETVEKTSSSTIDPIVFGKFVKKAQKLITKAIHDENGYHVTIDVNGKNISYNDKNLQNIRSAIGHIYRGEVAV